MDFGFFILSVLLIATICGVIYFFKQILDNVQFSKNPKTQRIAEIGIKVLIGILGGFLVYVVFENILILLEPLFEHMNAAFDTAVSKMFELLDKIIPWAVLGGVGWGLWKKYHPKPAPVDDSEDDPVDVEYAEQEAAELHEEVCELTYEATVDTSENTPLKRSQGSAGIETGREKPYTMDGTMAIHQFSVDTDTPLDKAGEALVLRELQRHMNQRGKRYPHLCREGRAPIIFDLKNNGNFVIIEVVLYSEKYKGKIEARRKARIARQQQTGDTYDRDF